MTKNGLLCLIPLAAAAWLTPAWAATGTLTANPNPCRIAPGAHECTTYLSWSTEGVQHARVYVRTQGKKAGPEKEFGTGPACAKCGASWIEAGTEYVFTLVDFSAGSRGGVLANITVTGVEGPGAREDGASGTIQAAPNPCRIEPGKADCTSYLSWSTAGTEHVRVFVKAEGAKASAEKEFAREVSCGKCGASWIEANTRYLFTVYDYASGDRGRALASVVVTAIK
ncbi:MAG: hypothetical protein ABSC93_13400 [Bryobacteraceae bacterium]|jgi:hypothetical protein